MKVGKGEVEEDNNNVAIITSSVTATEHGQYYDVVGTHHQYPHPHTIVEQEEYTSRDLLVESRNDDDNESDNFASCADGQEDHICYHGGECVPFDNQDGYYCDCTKAKEEEIENSNDVPYVGKWCHLPPETYCQSSKSNTSSSTFFCVNGGTCPTSNGTDDDDNHEQCLCSEEFVGRHCEYHKGDVIAAIIIDSEDSNSNDSDDPNNSSNNNNSNPPNECDLDCQHGSTCIWRDETNTGSYYCECLEGFEGAYCEEQQHQQKYLGTQCGNDEQQRCYHGSSCVRTIDGEYACDCQSIRTQHKNNNDPSDEPLDYAGRWCEYPATSYCDDDSNRHSFCVNNGTCVNNNSDGTYSCSCSDNYTGPMCEFLKNENNDSDKNKSTTSYQTCKLTCLNDGQCRKGSKPSLVNDQISVFNQNFEHCFCKIGFTGVACQHEYQECATNGTHYYCLHGSTCVQKDDGEWRCDCQTASRSNYNDNDDNTNQLFIGEFCQYYATSVCSHSNEMYNAANEMYNPATSLLFCVNGGTCTEILDDEKGNYQPACDCPHGYTGAHCELLDSSWNSYHHDDDSDDPQPPQLQNQGTGEDSTTSLLLVGSVLLGILLLILLLTLLCAIRWRQIKLLLPKKKQHTQPWDDQHQQQHSIARIHIMQEPMASLIDPGRREEAQSHLDDDDDFDEHHLEEVELL